MFCHQINHRHPRLTYKLLSKLKHKVVLQVNEPAKTDIINHHSQKLRSDRTAELVTIKLLPKSISIGSLKNSNIFIRSIFREPIPIIKDIEKSHGGQSTLKSGVRNVLRNRS